MATVNALDLIGKPADTKTYFQAEKIIKVAYGKDYPREKFDTLWTMTREENWTDERLKATVKWFVKTNIWRNWSLADFLNYSVNLHSYHWALAENTSNPGAMSRMEVYDFNGVPLYRYPDGTDIPLPRWTGKVTAQNTGVKDVDEVVSEQERAETVSILRKTINELSKKKSINNQLSKRKAR